MCLIFSIALSLGKGSAQNKVEFASNLDSIELSELEVLAINGHFQTNESLDLLTQVFKWPTHYKGNLKEIREYNGDDISARYIIAKNNRIKISYIDSFPGHYDMCTNEIFPAYDSRIDTSVFNLNKEGKLDNAIIGRSIFKIKNDTLFRYKNDRGDEVNSQYFAYASDLLFNQEAYHNGKIYWSKRIELNNNIKTYYKYHYNTKTNRMENRDTITYIYDENNNRTKTTVSGLKYKSELSYEFDEKKLLQTKINMTYGYSYNYEYMIQQSKNNSFVLTYLEFATGTESWSKYWNQIHFDRHHNVVLWKQAYIENEEIKGEKRILKLKDINMHRTEFEYYQDQ